MKTNTATAFSTNQLQPCQNLNSSHSSPSLWAQLLFHKNRLRLKQLLLSSMLCSLMAPFALALREAHAGLSATIQATSNFKTYLGLVFMLVGAPLVGVAYQLFPNTAASMDFSWYHVNYFHLFLQLCPDLKQILFITGAFLIVPRKLGFLLIIPTVYSIAHFVWTIQVTSNEEFNSLPTFTFYLLGFLLAIIWFGAFNWLMSLHFHKREGTKARILGLIDLKIMNELDDATFIYAITKEKHNLDTLN